MSETLSAAPRIQMYSGKEAARRVLFRDLARATRVGLFDILDRPEPDIEENYPELVLPKTELRKRMENTAGPERERIQQALDSPLLPWTWDNAFRLMLADSDALMQKGNFTVAVNEAKHVRPSLGRLVPDISALLDNGKGMLASVPEACRHHVRLFREELSMLLGGRKMPDLAGTLAYKREGFTEGGQNIYEITKAVVFPSYRRSGLFRRLHEQVIGRLNTLDPDASVVTVTKSQEVMKVVGPDAQEISLDDYQKIRKGGKLMTWDTSLIELCKANGWRVFTQRLRSMPRSRRSAAS